MVNFTDTSVNAIPSKDLNTNDLQQSDNEPHYESNNGAGDNVIVPAFSSSEDPKNINNYSSGTPADILPNNGETESQFYESDNGSEDFVDLAEIGWKPRKKAEKIPDGMIKDGEEAADVECESDNCRYHYGDVTTSNNAYAL